MNTTTLNREIDALGESVNGKPYGHPLWNAYYTQQSALVEQWKVWLHKTHSPELTAAQAAFVYAEAYERGHANGYGEIENEYIGLIDFVRKILAPQAVKPRSFRLPENAPSPIKEHRTGATDWQWEIPASLSDLVLRAHGITVAPKSAKTP